MASIDKDGMVVDGRVAHRRFPSIEHGILVKPRAIVVHQTGSSTTESTFNAYLQQATGAHFLIGKNGQIYQTASLDKQCYHVGKMIKSKCLQLKLPACKTPEMAQALALSGIAQFRAINSLERQKSYPDRYPVNSDSIGIELVGRHIDDKTYEAPTAAQNLALQWLVGQLITLLALDATDVHRHPEVSYKNPGEAQSAVWR